MSTYTLNAPDYRRILREINLGFKFPRGCENCLGDIFLEEDRYGRYFSCLQGSHMVDPDTDKGIALTMRAYDLDKKGLEQRHSTRK